MQAADVIAMLREPEKLMRRCYIHIAGGATRTASLPNAPLPPANGAAQVATFLVEVDPVQAVTGFTTGLSGLKGKQKSRTFVKITKLNGPAKTAPGADEFNAYYVPMVQTSDVTAATSHYTLPTTGQPDIMITSKLSGCRFGVGSDATGAVLVSHVQPDLSVAATTRQANLDTTLRSGFAQVKGVFAREGSYEAFASVIGVRSGTRWKFYQQASTKDYEKSEFIISSLSKIAA